MKTLRVSREKKRIYYHRHSVKAKSGKVSPPGTADLRQGPLKFTDKSVTAFSGLSVPQWKSFRKLA
jgi:hypothetical protein